MDDLHADTDLLNSATFWVWQDQMQGVIDDLQAEVDACLPIAKPIRKPEMVILKAVNGHCQIIKSMVLGFRDLCEGDADRVQALSDMLDKVEEINNRFAGFDASGDKH